MLYIDEAVSLYLKLQKTFQTTWVTFEFGGLFEKKAADYILYTGDASWMFFFRIPSFFTQLAFFSTVFLITLESNKKV